MLNYKPNVFAKNLRSSNSKLIAVCSEIQGYLDKAEFVNILEGLSESLRENFDIIFLCHHLEEFQMRMLLLPIMYLKKLFTK